MLKDLVSKMVKGLRLTRFHNASAKTDRRETILSPNVYIANTDSPKRRGVFARRHFKEGEVVERCPVLIIEEPVCELPEQLKTIVFDWGVLAKTHTSSAVALGFGSLYKLNAPSNMRYDVDTERSVLAFTTIRAVEKGEELTVDYGAIGNGPVWDSKDWSKRNHQPLHLESPDVYLKDTGTPKGRGAFASRNFSQGEIVAECPVILFKVPFSPPGDLKRLVFSWLALVKTGGPYAYALALGCGSMYNHDNPANMRYEANPENLTLRFISVRNISADEELTINYNALGGEAYSEDDNWFERAKVVPIVSDSPRNGD